MIMAAFFATAVVAYVVRLYLTGELPRESLTPGAR